MPDSQELTPTAPVHWRRVPQGALVALRGDLDLAGVDDFQEGINKALYEDPSAPLILDLRAVGFIDTTGLACLVKMAQTLKPRGRPFHVLVAPQSQVERAICRGRFHTMMNIVHSLEETGPGASALVPPCAPSAPAPA
jgi:anti-anti-sigma factor